MKITDVIGKEILREFARGVSVEDLCRRHGVGRESFYRWRRLYFMMSLEALHTTQKAK